MCLIMENLHKYVPAIHTNELVHLPDGDTIEVEKVDMWEVLFGGDQLTVARSRGARAIQASHPTADDRLEGLVPTIEDWHTRVILLKVHCMYMYMYTQHVPLSHTPFLPPFLQSFSLLSLPPS